MTVALILLLVLLLLLLVGFPIAFSLAMAAVAALLSKGTIPLTVVPQRLFTATDSFILLAVPFFVLAGELMQHGGISRRLVNFASDLLGWISGGLALVSIASAAFFAAISGSSAATTAAIGGVMYPEMRQRGYKPDFTAVVQAVGGTLGVVIPPSIPLIIYGVITGASIGDLFLAGIIPGLLGAAVYMAVAWKMAGKLGYKTMQRSSLKKTWHSFREASWGLLMPVIILGGIYGGVFTPTEAAVVAVVYALLVGFFIYKELNWKNFYSMLVKSGLTSAMIMLLIATASLFTWIMTIENIPQAITGAILSMTESKLVFLLLVNMVFLIAGMFLDTVAIILLLIPIFFPIALQLGVDPVHFGVIAVFNLAVGQMTPPFGVCLFVSSGVSGVSLEKLFKAVLPYLLAAFILILLLTYVPSLSLGILELFAKSI
ncbi:TRAP transporter large permease [Desulfoscipio geothermicus]|uniref:C4-dicarboxylate transporter, DctM subunit n=1 Tax=Desulfoscipio geothermicus DSM 3669 TaxID=1121426 RepID=A0A1I6DLR2_9FIRM|nr:TRAP transporter large permease [Desulfoscipio geothermicus]SFR06364.1 C4-dicarboxylate transporter, DctM subunit [Desulfoscipio geothermicus DSM 3669]